MIENIKRFSFDRVNLQSSFVVFLVALPLCLGIALASGAPASSGLIAGIVGGIVIGLLSPSEISVSGPAAGLTVLVASSIQEIGSFEAFCAVTVLAGVFQLLLGWARMGLLGTLIPSSVIKGMLAAIGILIILKQIPHAVGFDHDYFGDQSFFQEDHDNTFTAIGHAFRAFTVGAIVISLVSALILQFWDKAVKKLSFLSLIPAALIVVAVSVLLNEFVLGMFGWRLDAEHLVRLPEGDLIKPPSFQNMFSALTAKHFYLGGTIALVASIETLLSIDASEKIDPLKRGVDANKELYAQGTGNIVSGLLGGLPLTAVIVRTSANVTAGGTNRSSGVLHASWLLLFSLFLPVLLNKIPLAALAMILIFVGFKLTSPKLYKSFLLKGKSQMVPFIVTIVAIIFTNLLLGVLIGFFIGIFFVMRNNARSSFFLVEDHPRYLLRFSKDSSFLAKPQLKKLLEKVPSDSQLIIDGSRSVYIDHDIIDMVDDYVESAPQKRIDITLQKSPLALHPYFKDGI